MAIQVVDLAGPLDDFDAFYAEFAPRVRGLIRRRVRDDDRVEDLVQETFLRAHRSADTFDRDRPAWPWLATIANRLLIDDGRRAVTRLESSADVVTLDRASRGLSPEEQYERVEQRRTIAAALGSLPARQRRVLLLREVDEYHYDAAADREGVSVDTIKALLRRARTGFRVAYEQATVERGVLGVLPFMVRRAWARTTSAASRHAVWFDRLIEGIGAPVAAIIVTAGLATLPFLGEETNRSHVSDVAVNGAALDHSSGQRNATTAGGASARARGGEPSPPRAGKLSGLLPPGHGATSRLDGSGKNLEASHEVTVYVLGSPLKIWATGVTQCHTNEVHDALCAAVQQLPQEVTVGEPQDPPKPDDPPPPPSL